MRARLTKEPRRPSPHGELVGLDGSTTTDVVGLDGSTTTGVVGLDGSTTTGVVGLEPTEVVGLDGSTSTEGAHGRGEPAAQPTSPHESGALRLRCFCYCCLCHPRMLEQIAPLAPAPLAPEILCISAEAELCVCRRVAS